MTKESGHCEESAAADDVAISPDCFASLAMTPLMSAYISVSHNKRRITVKELVDRLLSGSITRRNFIKSMVALGVTAASAG
jgi:hypothetical protein